jgi:hypothetical protein
MKTRRLPTSVINIMTSENSSDFYKYIVKLGIVKKDPKLLILSSKHHFYYEIDEMKNIKTVINLKQLNDIDSLNDFLKLINDLQKNTILCGCFTNYKFFWSKKYYEMFLALIDLKMKRLISESNARSLLIAQNYKILDMKEINQITYFEAIKK